MDKKVKLLTASSLVAVLASGCTPYNARTGTYDNTQYGGGVSQNSQRDNTTCSPCQTNTTYTSTSTGEHTQQWYIDRWNREQNKPKYVPPKQTTYIAGDGGRSQQWYIDRWNKQQQNKPVYTPPPKKTYTGYGGAKPYVAPQSKGGDANYYDYSKQGEKYSVSNKQLYTGVDTRSNVTSKKDLYTGTNYNSEAYQPYTPKTYATGVNSNPYSDSSSIYTAASSNDTYGGSPTNSSYNGSGGEVASGSHKSGDKTYVVNKGDTVFSVMRLTGVYWKDIIKKNNLIAPYTISPGQTLRLK